MGTKFSGSNAAPEIPLQKKALQKAGKYRSIFGLKNHSPATADRRNELVKTDFKIVEQCPAIMAIF